MSQEELGEFYSRAIFCVRDVNASVAYYCDQLGFVKSWGDDAFAQVERGGLEIMLSRIDLQPKPSRHSVLSMSLRQPDQLGALYAAFQASGARVVSPPAPVEWQEGTLELRVEDLDGHILLFWGSD